MVDRDIATIVLASASPRRRTLLGSLGLAVETLPSGYAEPPLPECRPRELAVRHARAKLEAVLPQVGERLVVAADTVVDLDGVALGKPCDVAEATAMLQALSGREHAVHTAFALAAGGRRIEEVASTRVRFYPLSLDEIADYVATGEPFDKAGGYGIQGAAAAMVEAIEGDFYTVMGFPLARFVRALRRLGLSVPGAKARSHPHPDR